MLGTPTAQDGEMAQWVRALAALPEVLSGSQASIMGSSVMQMCRKTEHSYTFKYILGMGIQFPSQHLYWGAHKCL